LTPLICIDVGNTAVKVWRVKPRIGQGRGEADLLFTCPTQTNEAVIRQSLGEAALCTEEILYVSVVPAKNDLIEKFCKGAGIRCTKYDPANDPRISYTYVRPGHDRIAAAAGVIGAYDVNDFILVDAGTAVKVDLVTERTFRGGVIFPGAELCMRSLAANTAQLPPLSLEMIAPPGVDTASCMRAGVSNSLVFSISGFVSAYRKSYGSLPCFVTGGAGELYYTFSQGDTADLQYDPALIAVSLADYSSFGRP